MKHVVPLTELDNAAYLTETDGVLKQFICFNLETLNLYLTETDGVLKPGGNTYFLDPNPYLTETDGVLKRAHQRKILIL